jgi:hypothetical protein
VDITAAMVIMADETMGVEVAVEKEVDTAMLCEEVL